MFDRQFSCFASLKILVQTLNMHLIEEDAQYSSFYCIGINRCVVELFLSCLFTYVFTLRCQINEWTRLKVNKSRKQIMHSGGFWEN